MIWEGYRGLDRAREFIRRAVAGLADTPRMAAPEEV